MTVLKQVVVVGAAGMLGRAFEEELGSRSAAMQARFLTRTDCDVLQDEAIEAAIDASVDLVINCAAWTDVDGAESHREQAFALNAEAPGRLARRASAVGATLVHFSTDYVFDGQASTPYAETSETNPLNVYGQSKLAGERAVAETSHAHLILRTSWLYAPWGKNFVKTMLRLGNERDSLRVVNDQVGRPTSCLDLARATMALVERGARGVVHVANTEQTSWYGLATEVMLKAGLSCRVQPCESAAFPTVAKRPSYSVLGLDNVCSYRPRIELPTWQRALSEVLSDPRCAS